MTLGETTSPQQKGSEYSQPPVQIFVRVCPKKDDIQNNVDNNVLMLSSADKKHIKIRSRDGNTWQAFSFDGIFPETVTQHEVFTGIEQVMTGITCGISSTIFVYGQSGTGKTYTMFGRAFEGQFLASTWEDAKLHIHRHKHCWGIVPLAVHKLFLQLDSCKDNVNGSVVCSYMQVYNDKVYDLLEERKLGALSIRENKNTYVEGLTMKNVYCVDDVFQLLHQGASYRKIRATHFNQHSVSLYFKGKICECIEFYILIFIVCIIAGQLTVCLVLYLEPLTCNN